MIAFAKARRRVLAAVFTIVTLSAAALFLMNAIWPAVTPESWGWMMLFGALPWSIAATVVPGVFSAMIIAVGLGLNAVIVLTITWYVFSWWLKSVRPGGDA